MRDPRLHFPDHLRAICAPKRTRFTPPPPPALPEDLTPAHRNAVATALRGEADRVRRARRGTRTVQLFNSAAALGNFVGFGCLDPGDVRATLISAAAECGLLDDKGFPFCRTQIENGLRIGIKTPRDPAPRATARLRDKS